MTQSRSDLLDILKTLPNDQLEFKKKNITILKGIEKRLRVLAAVEETSLSSYIQLVLNIHALKLLPELPESNPSSTLPESENWRNKKELGQ